MKDRRSLSEIDDVPDMVAVMADAAFVDQISRRDGLAELLVSAPDDPVAASLIAFVGDVDRPSITGSREWAQALVLQLDSREWTGQVTPIAPRGRRSLSLVAAATVAGMVLASAGAAAAVTGDPLTPLRLAVAAVGRVVPNHEPTAIAGPPVVIPSQAANPAQVNARLAGIGAALAQGRLDNAQAQLDAVHDWLGGGVDLPLGQAHRLHNLEVRLAAAGGGSGKHTGHGSGSGHHDKTPHSTTGHDNTAGAGKNSSGKPASGQTGKTAGKGHRGRGSDPTTASGRFGGHAGSNTGGKSAGADTTKPSHASKLPQPKA